MYLRLGGHFCAWAKIIDKPDEWDSIVRYFKQKLVTENASIDYRIMTNGLCLASASYTQHVHNVLASFFEREFRASTIQSTVAIETTIKALGHANILLDFATNDSFKDENEGDAVDSEANSNGAANAVEAKVINGHVEKEAIYQMMLPYL
ncbi:hypothetical protein MAM1_0006c00742 [Mucor ambiguus]|uniref:Uncharacterized protein n=1 Tax=Mucor ambiguus TaxID=91626 RepID=A0A0C9M4Q2_9FUNG|nr:hypothetical protein MAM1_0006c00742 [Mucor ambiguus]